MAALDQREAEDGVAASRTRRDGDAGLSVGVGLDDDVLSAEELPRAVASEVLGDVDDLAAAAEPRPG